MFSMHFRESDYDAIKRKADKDNLNFTEFVTRSALDKPIVVIEGLSDVLKEQNRKKSKSAYYTLQHGED